MGTSGTALYSDDTASDVRDEFVELLSRLRDPAQATGSLVRQGRNRGHQLCPGRWRIDQPRRSQSLPNRGYPHHRSTGDRWSMSRARFDAKYQSLPPLPHGSDGRYQARPLPVLARQISEPFTVARSAGGDLLRGLARDWLLQYAPGDYELIENARFQQVYCAVPVSP